MTRIDLLLSVCGRRPAWIEPRPSASQKATNEAGPDRHLSSERAPSRHHSAGREVALAREALVGKKPRGTAAVEHYLRAASRTTSTAEQNYLLAQAARIQQRSQ
jgi:hypothetical protein